MVIWEFRASMLAGSGAGTPLAALAREIGCGEAASVSGTDLSTHRYAVLRQSVFGVLSDPVLRKLAERTHSARLLAGHVLYDPEVMIVAVGLVRAFISDGAGRQLTVAYRRPGQTLALAHLAGRRYPTAFQSVGDSGLLVLGDDLATELQRAHPELGWSAAQELSRLVDEVETELGRVAFGSLRQRLAAHLLALSSEAIGSHQPIHLSQLAVSVGSSREVVHRYLRTLADEGCIRIESDGVLVQDRGRLRDHAKID